MRILAVAVGLLAAAPAWAQSGTRYEVLSGMGKRVKEVLEGHEARAVRLGALVGDKQPEANAGPGLLYDLQNMLVGLKIDVTARADFELRGRYELVKLAKTDEHAIELKLEIYWHGRKRVVATLIGYLTSPQQVVEAAGLTVDLPPNADKDAVNEAIRRATDDEKIPAIDGSRVRAAMGSPYAMELLVKQRNGTYAPVEPAAKNGEAYARLSKDDVYAIRLTNNADHEIAVTLSIDGLNLFSFNPKIKFGKHGHPRVLVEAKRSRLIKGWPQSLKMSDEFLVTAYPQTAAAKKLKKLTGDLGVVTAVIVPCWVKGKKPKNFRSASGPLGTGFGDPVKTPLKMVEREFGDNPTSIAIRYTAQAK